MHSLRVPGPRDRRSDMEKEERRENGKRPRKTARRRRRRRAAPLLGDDGVLDLVLGRLVAAVCARTRRRSTSAHARGGRARLRKTATATTHSCLRDEERERQYCSDSREGRRARRDAHCKNRAPWRPCVVAFVACCGEVRQKVSDSLFVARRTRKERRTQANKRYCMGQSDKEESVERPRERQERDAHSEVERARLQGAHRVRSRSCWRREAVRLRRTEAHEDEPARRETESEVSLCGLSPDRAASAARGGRTSRT